MDVECLQYEITFCPKVRRPSHIRSSSCRRRSSARYSANAPFVLSSIRGCWKLLVHGNAVLYNIKWSCYRSPNRDGQNDAFINPIWPGRTPSMYPVPCCKILEGIFRTDSTFKDIIWYFRTCVSSARTVSW